MRRQKSKDKLLKIKTELESAKINSESKEGLTDEVVIDERNAVDKLEKIKTRKTNYNTELILIILQVIQCKAIFYYYNFVFMRNSH